MWDELCAVSGGALAGYAAAGAALLVLFALLNSTLFAFGIGVAAGLGIAYAIVQRVLDRLL